MDFVLLDLLRLLKLTFLNKLGLFSITLRISEQIWLQVLILFILCFQQPVLFIIKMFHFILEIIILVHVYVVCVLDSILELLVIKLTTFILVLSILLIRLFESFFFAHESV